MTTRSNVHEGAESAPAAAGSARATAARASGTRRRTVTASRLRGLVRSSGSCCRRPIPPPLDAPKRGLRAFAIDVANLENTTAEKTINPPIDAPDQRWRLGGVTDTPRGATPQASPGRARVSQPSRGKEGRPTGGDCAGARRRSACPSCRRPRGRAPSNRSCTSPS